MTVICGLHHRGETWIGADSRATGNHGIVFASSVKKWAVGPSAAIGLSGEAIGTQVLHRNRDEILKTGAPMEIVDRMADALKPHFKESGDGDGAKAWGFTTLLATHHAIYDVDSTFMALEIESGVLWARGSGKEYAIGAGHAMRGDNPMARIRRALEAACQFDSGCGGQLFIHRLGDPLP
jgi:ATP-dependent protease HslVU (ClpYQ) peptidase subunit